MGCANSRQAKVADSYAAPSDGEDGGGGGGGTGAVEPEEDREDEQSHAVHQHEDGTPMTAEEVEAADREVFESYIDMPSLASIGGSGSFSSMSTASPLGGPRKGRKQSVPAIGVPKANFAQMHEACSGESLNEAQVARIYRKLGVTTPAGREVMVWDQYRRYTQDHDIIYRRNTSPTPLSGGANQNGTKGGGDGGGSLSAKEEGEISGIEDMEFGAAADPT